MMSLRNLNLRWIIYLFVNKLPKEDLWKIGKEDLLNNVYDLVLSAETKEEERQVLLVFKNAVEAGKDFDKSVVNLASDLRKIVSKHF